MKKIISLLTALAILILTVPMSVSAKTSGDISEEKGLLIMLGIFSEEDFENDDTLVTRGEFAGYIAKLLSINTNDYVNARYFKDVPSSRREAGAVNALYERGIMVGVGDYEFLIDEPMKSEHAANVLKRVAGYPKGYTDLDMTATAEILAGIKDTTFNKTQAAAMIYNTLMLPYIDMADVSNGFIEYDKNEDYLVLEELFDIYCIEGRVTGVEGVGIMDNSSVTENTVTIDNEIFENGFDKAYEFVGMYVNAYIQKDKDGVGTLVFLSDDSDEVITITADDIISVSDNYEIRYTENGASREKTVRLPQNVRVIKNGLLVKSNVRDAMDIDSGYIKIIENKDGDYDVVRVSEFKSAMISAIDTDNERIYLKNAEPIELSLKSLKRIKIYNKDGDNIGIGSLKAGDFISYFISDVSAEIYVLAGVISGSVDGVLDDGVNTLVSISGTEAAVNTEYYTQNKDKFAIGTSGLFYMDYDGKIAYVVLDNGGDTFAYVINANILEDTDTLQLKVYTQNGEMLLLKSAGARIKVDGKTVTQEEALAALKKGGSENQVIAYTVNKNGEITSIDTPTYNKDSESEYSLRKTVEQKSLNYLPNSKSFGVVLPTGKNTVIMQIPQENGEISTNLKDFAINPAYVGYTKYIVDGYSINPDSIFPSVIVTGKVESEQSWSYVVESVTESLNADGEAVKTIRIGGTGGVSSINVSDTFTLTEADKNAGYVSCDDIAEGDVIKITTDGRGEISKILHVLDYDKDTTFDTSKLQYYGSYEKWNNESWGYVKKVEDGYYKFGNLENDEKDEIMPLINNAIIVYDSERRKDEVYIGTYDDIKSFEDVGENASVIITNQRNGQSQLTIVFKNGADMFKGK